MVSSNNSINNTIGASISGVTNTLVVTNPSNTASSVARKVITTGGSSASDPYLNFNVNGVTDFSFGIDNSSSDSLIVSQSSTIGTNNCFTDSVNGEINLPLQPVFSAYSSGIANFTGNDIIGTGQFVIFDTENFDVGSNYSTVNGKFTAPVTGKYAIFSTIGLSNIGSQTVFLLQITKNSSLVYRYVENKPSVVKSSSNSLILGNGFAYFTMTAGDFMQINITCVGTSKTVNLLSSSTFAGYLVC